MSHSESAPSRARPASRLTALAAALVAAAIVVSPLGAQVRTPQIEMQAVPVNSANWLMAERFSTTAMRQAIYTAGVQPRWIGETDSLWYNYRDRNGSRFTLVLPGTRSKVPLFDHVRLAAALAEMHRRPYEPNNLPFTTLNFTKDHKRIRFTVDTVRYEWHLTTQTLKSLGRPPRDTIPTDEERDVREQRFGFGNRGGRGGPPDFRNFSPDSTVFVFARDHNLYLVEVGKPDTIQITTDGERNYSFGFRDTLQVQQQQQQDDDDGDQEDRDARSRDPRVRANVIWSPDSKAFAVTRNDQRKVKELYLVNVLAEPRPTLRSYAYAMPGEQNVAQVELYVHRRGEAGLTPIDVKRWKDQRLLHIHWTVGSDKLRLARRDRLQRNLELIEVDLAGGAITPLLSESVENSYLETQPVRYTKGGGDMIWWSERSGFGHYYLYDHAGKLKRPLTRGSWRAEGIAEIDSVRGVIYIQGVGREEGEDPYYRHLYRVNADGSGFALIDPGNFNHTSTVSPTKKYVVDTYSRVDAAPRSVLRDAFGREIMALEEMDISRLVEMGWRPPERFVVKAADGITDIYGNMWKPFDFDSTRQYPIIAHVYPGPQTESVISSFSPAGTPQQLAQLGFIVIQIGNRGGSPQRSNAYHSFGYFNLRDYALADKKTGIEQLAARHKWIDVRRVGIYGHSGGGFLTAAAMLQPPYNDFFKVGVSSAGNHDNNIYNQNWSEQHHGLRLVAQRGDSARTRGRRATAGSGDGNGGGAAGTADSLASEDSLRFEIKVPTNAELAGNLKGKLLLVHGDMDNNVHPGNTIRLVNALIKANKRFDMMMLPGKAHGFADMQPYFTQMMFEYFAEHLLGDYYRAGADIQ
ncbi:MAG TPA: DPP IV N-terminal domain-containing protein [Gemmatimonadaceae bacterium]|nr:DPP IV N-terminal domain-containing protein [Gemmatimonadaceae bacterium]